MKSKEIPMVYFDVERIPWGQRFANLWSIVWRGRTRIMIRAEWAKNLLEELQRKDLLMKGKTDL